MTRRVAHLRRPRPGLQGLRPRLVLTFLVVALSTGLAAVVMAALAFRLYRDRSGAPLTPEQLVQLFVLVVLGLLVLSVSLALLAARRVLEPVGRLAEAAERIAQGDLQVRLPVTGTDEMADLTATFNAMAGSLDRSVSELRRLEARARRFAGDVSHELRTPLAAMVAVSDLLEDRAASPGTGGALDRDTAAAIALVGRETRNLDRLVHDLIEISRFDASTATLVTDEVDVADLVRGCLRARGWTADVGVDVPAGLRVQLDPRRIDVVVANLVANALRHGGPPVAVAAGRRRSADRDWLVLEVRDGGPGLAPAVLPFVFERFWKADTSRARSEGSGLGLAIAAENARLHGGSVAAGNRPEGGAVFTLRLPLGRVAVADL